MNKIQAVIFDCDGVMFDTTKANMAYYNTVLEHFNRPKMNEEQFIFVHMHTVDEAIEFLFKNPESIDKANKFRSNLNYLPFLKQMAIEPYLKPLLQKIIQNHKTAVATNRTDSIDRVLKTFQLDSYFNLVISALDVSRPKPYPDSLLKILTSFQIAPDKAIYIGDSKLDEMAANRARIPFVAYRNKALEAKYHIDSLKKVEGLLDC